MIKDIYMPAKKCFCDWEMFNARKRLNSNLQFNSIMEVNTSHPHLMDLSFNEQASLNGGHPIAYGLAIAAGAEIIRDWDNFKRGIAGRPEQ